MIIRHTIYVAAFLSLAFITFSSIGFAQSIMDDDTSIDNPHIINSTTGPVGSANEVPEYYKIPLAELDMISQTHDLSTIKLVGNVDETLKVYDDYFKYFYGNEDAIDSWEKQEFWDDHHVNLITDMWPNGRVEIAFDDLHQDDIDEMRTTLAKLYPDSALFVRIGGIALDSPSSSIKDTITLDNKITKSKTFNYHKTLNRALVDNGDSLEKIDAVNMTEHITITSLTLTVVINHEDHDELNGYLEDPDGDIHRIFARPRGVSDGSHTWTVDLNNSYFSSLKNTDAFGQWTLKVGDYRSGDIGSVVSWSLKIEGNAVSPDAGSDNRNAVDPSILELIDDFFSLILTGGVDKICNFITDDCMPTLAAMPMNSLVYDDDGDAAISDSSITLGGVQTENGDMGFVASLHAVTLDPIEKSVYRDIRISGDSVAKKHLLGSVHTYNVTDTKISDSVFIKYPIGCSEIQIDFRLCTEAVPYVPIVAPLKIFKGNNVAYEVVGEVIPTKNMVLKWAGKATGIQSATYSITTANFVSEGIPMKAHALLTSVESKGTDSGGPIFQELSNGDANIAGILVGHDMDTSMSRNYMSLWSDIKSDLGLQTINVTKSDS